MVDCFTVNSVWAISCTIIFIELYLSFMHRNPWCSQLPSSIPILWTFNPKNFVDRLKIPEITRGFAGTPLSMWLRGWGCQHAPDFMMTWKRDVIEVCIHTWELSRVHIDTDRHEKRSVEKFSIFFFSLILWFLQILIKDSSSTKREVCAPYLTPQQALLQWVAMEDVWWQQPLLITMSPPIAQIEWDIWVDTAEEQICDRNTDVLGLWGLPKYHPQCIKPCKM